jgi:hypothetical protein
MTLSARYSIDCGIVSDLLCRFQIDHQLKLRRLLHRQIGGFGSLKDFAYSQTVINSAREFAGFYSPKCWLATKNRR